MKSYIGLSGVIGVHPGTAITVKGVQIDYNNSIPSGAWVSISGSLGGGDYTFSAIEPVVSDINFAYDEDVFVTYTDNGATVVNNIAINYIYRGDQIAYMTMDPSRIHRTPSRNLWTRT